MQRLATRDLAREISSLYLSFICEQIDIHILSIIDIDLYIGFRRSVEIHRLVEFGVARLVYRFCSQSAARRYFSDRQYIQLAKGIGEALDVHRY